MATRDILTEVPPIAERDSFVIFERKKSSFNFPIHIHKEYELNFIENAKGAQRIVGDHVSEIDDLELVLISGSNLEHAWLNHTCTSDEIYEVTIQFSPELFKSGFIEKKQFFFIKKMLDQGSNGLAFSRETIISARPVIMELLRSTDSFGSVLIFLRLLNQLSRAQDSKVLSHSIFAKGINNYDSRRIKMVMDYLSENYKKPIKLIDVASMVNMSEASFSRFIKLRTGKNFIDCLNEIRVSAASRYLIDEPTCTIAEIAYKSGFNNLSNFNRIFKKKRSFTPQEFREQYVKRKIII
ncbi:AraC family transcriptional regulator [uncultured Acetobacteroides sp.]|uniref:AraC family transcriptional regulator n=1 Tax=uncultured Acetobacteroides sp. TaxID=1760811 RepID=UPI0029F59423|nr:AraC family transcriptional regulator [uncultured Acetobacteroides sp.]